MGRCPASSHMPYLSDPPDRSDPSYRPVASDSESREPRQTRFSRIPLRPACRDIERNRPFKRLDKRIPSVS